LDTLSIAKNRGLWNDDEPLEIAGDFFDKAKRPIVFSIPNAYNKRRMDSPIFRFILSHLWINIHSQPKINNRKCKKCFLCKNACPVSAIEVDTISNKLIIDEKKCIQCFCCHEVCPHHAVSMKKSLLVKISQILNRLKIWRAKDDATDYRGDRCG